MAINVSQSRPISEFTIDSFMSCSTSSHLFLQLTIPARQKSVQDRWVSSIPSITPGLPSLLKKPLQSKTVNSPFIMTTAWKWTMDPDNMTGVDASGNFIPDTGRSDIIVRRATTTTTTRVVVKMMKATKELLQRRSSND
jgi:hypothetical protein